MLWELNESIIVQMPTSGLGKKHVFNECIFTNSFKLFLSDNCHYLILMSNISFEKKKIIYCTSIPFHWNRFPSLLSGGSFLKNYPPVCEDPYSCLPFALFILFFKLKIMYKYKISFTSPWDIFSLRMYFLSFSEKSLYQCTFWRIFPLLWPGRSWQRVVPSFLDMGG